MMTRSRLLLLTIPLVWVLFHLLSDGSVLTPGNMVNLFKYLSVVGILAAGMTLVIGAGHIDLSVGSLLGFLGAMNALLLQAGWPLWPALGVGVLLGLVTGLIHGALVAYLRVPSFIATLSGLLAYLGLKQYLANPVIPLRDPALIRLGQGYLTGTSAWILLAAITALIFWSTPRRNWKGAAVLVVALGAMTFTLLQDRGIPLSVLALGAAGALCHFVAVRTRMGRYVFALGSNAEAARYAGIPVKPVTLFAFGLMGVMAWLAGLTATSQLMAGAADVGDQQELYAIAACVLGGTSLRGGSGSVWLSILGAVLMASILNGMEQMGIPSTMQKVILGLILTAAVASDWTARKETA